MEKTPQPIKTVDAYYEKASEPEQNIANHQAESYKASLLILMERSGVDATLINSMRDFLGELQANAMFGDSSKPIVSSKVAALTEFFQKGASELKNLARGIR